MPSAPDFRLKRSRDIQASIPGFLCSFPTWSSTRQVCRDVLLPVSTMPSFDVSSAKASPMPDWRCYWNLPRPTSELVDTSSVFDRFTSELIPVRQSSQRRQRTCIPPMRRSARRCRVIGAKLLFLGVDRTALGRVSNLITAAFTLPLRCVKMVMKPSW